jgi:4-amino-4-deoxychorismate lyase
LPIHALINGVAGDALAIGDRGLMYGDGLFETIAVRQGLPCLWHAHVERLRAGSRRLAIPCPSPETLYRECVQVADGCAACVVKLVLTRGGGGRGYAPPQAPEPTRILLRYPWPEYPPQWGESGVAALWCQSVLAEQPLLAGIKHLNRLEQVLARAEWRDPEIAEGVVCDTRGRVIGGTMSNLFVVTGERLWTPRIDTCGILGTARALTLECALALGLEAAETDLAPGDLAEADGAFLTNALIGVWPLRALGGHSYDPGRLPARLIAEVRRAVHEPTRAEAV